MLVVSETAMEREIESIGCISWSQTHLPGVHATAAATDLFSPMPCVVIKATRLNLQQQWHKSLGLLFKFAFLGSIQKLFDRMVVLRPFVLGPPKYNHLYNHGSLTTVSSSTCKVIAFYDRDNRGTGITSRQETQAWHQQLSACTPPAGILMSWKKTRQRNIPERSKLSTSS